MIINIKSTLNKSCMSFSGNRASVRVNRKERIVYRCIGEKKNVEQIVIYELDRILSNDGIDDIIDILYKDMGKKMIYLPSVIKKAEQELSKTTNDINNLLNWNCK